MAYVLISRMPNFSRLIFLQATLVTALAVGLLLVAPLTVAAYGPSGVFLPLSGFLLATLALSFGLADLGRSERAGASGEARLAAVLGAAAAALLVSAGSNTLWLFLEQIGRKVGVGLGALVLLTAASATTCIAIPYVAFLVSRRIGSFWPGVALCAGQAALSLAFTQTSDSATFLAVAAALNIAYVWSMVSIRMLSAECDLSGRATAATAGGESAGMVLGPSLAGGATMIWSGYATVGVLGVALFAGAAAAPGGLPPPRRQGGALRL